MDLMNILLNCSECCQHWSSAIIDIAFTPPKYGGVFLQNRRQKAPPIPQNQRGLYLIVSLSHYSDI